jgi:hypothetical protein
MMVGQEENIMASHESFQPVGAQLRGMDDRPEEEVAKALDSADPHADPDEPFPEGVPLAAPSQWRVSDSLRKLRDQVNAKFPGRKKDSDGTIGDTAHCPGGSDHCPNINEGSVGIVTAMDITHDPAHGLDAGIVADTLRLSHDPRIKYIISNGRIANFKALGGKPPFAWRPYTGRNPHTKHFHISVKPGKTGLDGYDTTTDWSI